MAAIAAAVPWQNLTPTRSSPWLRVYVPKGFSISEVRMKEGDDPLWAEPGLQDDTWEDISEKGLPARRGIFWIRYHVRGKGELPAGIHHKVGAAYELFWDGKFLGRSGQPGDSREEEEPGKIDTLFTIPAEWLRTEKDWKSSLRVLPVRIHVLAERLRAGETRKSQIQTSSSSSSSSKSSSIQTGSASQDGKTSWESRTVDKRRTWETSSDAVDYVVAMRMSNHRYGFPGDRTDLFVWFKPMAERMAARSSRAIAPTPAAGAMGTIVIIGLILWTVAMRRWVLILFIGFCLCAAVTQLFAAIRHLTSYPYDLHFALRQTAFICPACKASAWWPSYAGTIRSGGLLFGWQGF